VHQTFLDYAILEPFGCNLIKFLNNLPLFVNKKSLFRFQGLYMVDYFSLWLGKTDSDIEVSLSETIQRRVRSSLRYILKERALGHVKQQI